VELCLRLARALIIPLHWPLMLQQERRPAALHYSQLSNHNLKRSLRVPEALGLDTKLARRLASQRGMHKVGVSLISWLDYCHHHHSWYL